MHGKTKLRDIPGGIHVCSPLNQEPHDVNMTSGTGGMQWENAIEDRVDRLTVDQGVLYEAEVACCRGRVQAQTGNWEV